MERNIDVWIEFLQIHFASLWQSFRTKGWFKIQMNQIISRRADSSIGEYKMTCKSLLKSVYLFDYIIIKFTKNNNDKKKLSDWMSFIFTSVYCDADKEYEKASQWTEGKKCVGW